MHVNGTAPLEASSEEASNSAYSRMTVLRHDATENVSAKKNPTTPPCLLHFDDAFECCICIRDIFDLENSDKYKKKKDSSGSIPLFNLKQCYT